MLARIYDLGNSIYHLDIASTIEMLWACLMVGLPLLGFITAVTVGNARLTYGVPATSVWGVILRGASQATSQSMPPFWFGESNE